MKLVQVTSLRLSAITAVVLAFWSLAFYSLIVTEMNDELDDTLENYAEVIIRRKLKGEELPSQSSGSNNQYFLRPITQAEASSKEHIVHRDVQVYIEDKNDYEPARIISYIFQSEQGTYYELEVSTPTIDQADLRETIFWSVLVLYLSISLSILVINMWTIRYSMRPLRIALGWLARYQLNKPNEPLRNPTKIDEFAQLNQGIEAAMQRSEDLYRQQRLFIGNASHELQTPLAISLNRLEMLLEDEALEERQLGELLKIRQTLLGLSKLNRSLLLLSKIENGQYAEEVEDIDVGERTRQLLDDYETTFAHRHLKVSISQTAPLVLRINEGLATTLLTNLLKNAFVHNIEQGEIRVEIEARRARFMNTGSDTPLDEALIFTPFYHTQSLQSSTGLGLALVKTICEQSALRLSYRYAAPYHCFELSLD